MNKKIILASLLTISLAAPALYAKNSIASNIEQNQESDGLESYNRTMFKFNYRFDKYIMKPVAEGYRAITNETIRARVRYFFANLREPISFGNHLLQAEFKQASISLGRFAVNSTLGLGGMFDVAEGWGWKKKQVTFDDTLAKWCVKDGPFIVLPFLGPSTPRAATSMLVDTTMDPVYWSLKDSNDDAVKYGVFYGMNALKFISMREAALDLTNELEKDSVDFYATMRSAYLQNRANKNNCYGDGASSNSYDFDFGTEDEDTTYQEMEDK